jgi:uncharacterized damage-inducible protein DinB
MTHIPKPPANEYAPYTIAYIAQVPDDGRVLEHLKHNVEVIKQHIMALPEEKLATPCAPGEWTVKEILVHIMDSERVFAYRALRVARNDMTPLPGFEQEDYVPHSNANARSLDSIFAEYAAIRAATLTFFDSLDDAAWLRIGTASHNPVSVRASAFIIAGHELYHLASIKQNYG